MTLPGHRPGDDEPRPPLPRLHREVPRRGPGLFSGLVASFLVLIALLLSVQAVDWRGSLCLLFVVLVTAIVLTIYPITRTFGGGLLIGLIAGLVVAATLLVIGMRSLRMQF